jgi:hypothetical protein
MTASRCEWDEVTAEEVLTLIGNFLPPGEARAEMIAGEFVTMWSPRERPERVFTGRSDRSFDDAYHALIAKCAKQFMQRSRERERAAARALKPSAEDLNVLAVPAPAPAAETAPPPLPLPPTETPTMVPERSSFEGHFALPDLRDATLDEWHEGTADDAIVDESHPGWWCLGAGNRLLPAGAFDLRRR